MNLIKPGKILVFASTSSVIQVPAGKEITLVTAATRLFPAIHQFQPEAIFFDYEYTGADIERILRRLKSNVFYKKIKIYCYKKTWHTRTDSLLKTLGIDTFIYADDLQKQLKSKKHTFTALGNLLETAVASAFAGSLY